MKKTLKIALLSVMITYTLAARVSVSRSGVVDLTDELEISMTKGGDDRIVLAAGGDLNRYFTGPKPQSALISRSSSTSSNTSVLGFLAAQQLFDRLRAAQDDGGAARYFEFSMDHIRQQVKHFWGAQASKPCYVITSPSGSDVEMLPTVAALLRNKQWQPNVTSKQPLVLNIVMACGEVGSGTVLAATLRNFSSLTPSGNHVMVGKQITGVSAGIVKVEEIKIRDDQGVVVLDQDLEKKLAVILQQAIERDEQQVVLHMVHASKTGIGAPRVSFLRSMKQKYQDNLIVVVDAAQLRMNETAAGMWLDENFWVLITGSKFLGGTSFAGAILIPHGDAALLAAASSDKIPAGLGEYFTPSDCDEFFANVQRGLFPWYNVGLALRWSAALAEAERFYTIPAERRDRGISHWVHGVHNLIKQSKHLVLLGDVVQDIENRSFQTCIGKCNTVVSFGVRVAQADGSYRFLHAIELRKMYELMITDLSDRLKNLSSDQRGIAMTLCLTGQPVQIATAGPCTAVLRLALAAPELYKSIGHERVDPAVLVDEILDDDQLLVQKLDLIALCWAELSS